MSCNWPNVTKYLDRNQGTRDTTYDKDRGRGRAIAKIPYRFTIPSLPFDTPVPVQGIIVYQCNYVATHNFRIIDTGTGYLHLMPKVFICIKYRVGGTVYRYRLPISKNSINVDLAEPQYLLSIQCPKYDQQLIQPNFTLEWWSGTPFGGDAGGIFYQEYDVVTNYIANPDSSEEQFRIIAENPRVLTRSDLDETLAPEVIPTPYTADSSWLTN